MLKTCFKCGAEKPLKGFYRHPKMADGHMGKCRECTKRDVRANYARRRRQYQEYERKRNQEPVRRRQMIEAQRRRRKRHPLRYKARMDASNAIRDGRLIRGPCECCGSKRAQAHHDDYSKPLEVRWLCFKCHRAWHGQTVL